MILPFVSLSDAIKLAYRTPETELERLETAYCKAIVDTWSASCATDRYIDLTPYRDAERLAYDALLAYTQTQTEKTDD